jgi:serine phosphatase RsbU (regulator of sigma subunit)
VALFTDGFFEWADAEGKQYGIERLQERIHEFRALPAAEMIRRIYDDVLAFAAGTTQRDDLTAVVVKRG